MTDEIINGKLYTKYYYCGDHDVTFPDLKDGCPVCSLTDIINGIQSIVDDYSDQDGLFYMKISSWLKENGW